MLTVMTEQLPYTVLRSFPDCEIRRYSNYILVQCEEHGDFLSAGYRGFSPLFQFISGNNSMGKKIAMTAPVFQQEVTPQQHLVSFVMPQSFSMVDVPRALHSRMHIEEVEGHDVLAMKFGGSWNEIRMKNKADELLRAAAREGLAITGECFYARYDPPWKPGFLKRNEVLISLAHPFDQSSEN